MNLHAFLHDLHFRPERIRAANWVVDWDNAPPPYKLYQGGVRAFALPSPLQGSQCHPPPSASQPSSAAQESPSLEDLSTFLWLSYGLTHLDDDGRSLKYHRMAASGGGLYPNELYLHLKLPSLPAGLYHYDPAHHRLLLLREGDYTAYLEQSLGGCGRCDLSACFATVIVSAVFWKNFFKYHNLSYRLQALDAGVLLGQLLEASKFSGYTASVQYRFLDRALNHLLGLQEQEESVYAVVPLSTAPASFWYSQPRPTASEKNVVSADDLCREIPELHLPHNLSLKPNTPCPYPMLLQLNEASLQHTTAEFRPLQPPLPTVRTPGHLRNHSPFQTQDQTHDRKILKKIPSSNEALSSGEIPLPALAPFSHDLMETGRKRFSPGMDFMLGKISLNQIAILLQNVMASFSYANDLEENRPYTPSHAHEPSRLTLHTCIYGADDIPAGAYAYDHHRNTLCLIHPGDHRHRLQQGMRAHNVNLSMIPFLLHITGTRDHYTSSLGFRGYRIQQMEAGMLAHRILLLAAALGLGGHALLDFQAALVDQVYDLPPRGLTSLLQLAVGPCRTRPHLLGGLVL